jgi:hypothetical protein
MTRPSFQNKVIAVAIFLLTGHGAAATGSVQVSPSAGGSPSEACFYTVAPHNMIAQGLEHVLVITDPGASGYRPDDVKYIFRNSAFTIAKGGDKASDVVGHVPVAALKAGAQKAPLFLADCHKAKSKRTQSAASVPG